MIGYLVQHLIKNPIQYLIRGGEGGGPSDDGLLLGDGVSFLLLGDNQSFLLLGT